MEDQLAELCHRLGLSVEIVAGDSRTVEAGTGEVDLVFIDGDHAYEAVRRDFERFATRVARPSAGGALREKMGPNRS